MRVTRRAVLLGAAAAAAVPGCMGRKYGLSRSARELLQRVVSDLGPRPVLDAHVHIVGRGVGGTGCEIHPKMEDLLGHPKDWVRFQAYQAAADVDDLAQADAQFVAAFLRRLRALPMDTQAMIFAFDRLHDEQGRPQPDLSAFHTPNAYVLGLARAHPELLAVASIHPYRADAVDALHTAAEAGAVAVKWLPNAQGIDPSSSRCDAMYAALQNLQLPLITHAGHEQAVDSEGLQQLGDPLRLRRALDAGVTTIVAHCGSLGEYPDIDDPQRSHRTSLDLFLRLMDSPEYEGRLWGEISALTMFNRIDTALPTILRRKDLHSRLIHGSDYPLPGIDLLFNTWQIRAAELIDSSDRGPLSELWNQNPLLFDFALKRCVRLPDDPDTRFPASVFQPPDHLFPRIQR